ncbi:hypothetical protein CYMTET_50514 [Cymbomonas tetramitiformis]|uniref:Alpha-galactosidase n=1 Tax=Cymbomonas tetramitiformis TaxID=36881 RepID=A0AAE0BN35_9CHLO|nr:hypothetical protein CYMTET_50514 [Cymbomonas tetramitiformis]
MRGISTTAVKASASILGTSYHAGDIGLISQPCPWWKGTVAVNLSHSAGQMYYDSIYSQYAEWGVDFIKNDCVFGDDFSPAEIVAQAKAIERTGRPMIYSISPGSTKKGTSGEQVSMANEIKTHVNMYRVTADDWDSWSNVTSHFAVANECAQAELIEECVDHKGTQSSFSCSR